MNAAGAAMPTSRPRLVMLVDGGVVGDSRVQKSAQAAFDAGWDVTLVGRAPNGVADELRIGDVPVRRIAAPYALLAHERRSPPGRWRYPLAYPNGDDVTAARRLLDARWVDYQADVQLGKRRLAAGAGPAEQVAVRGGLIGRRAAWVAGSYWHRLRGRQFRQAVAHAKSPDGPLDTLAVLAQRAVLGQRSWRRLDPVLWDLEIAFGPVVDELAPDLIHAHDFRMSGIAVRAAARAFARGRRVPVVYDVHEYVPGVHSRSRRWRTANTAHEREYVGHADAVVTVSPKLAEMLRRDYRLPETPTVVLNAPLRQPPADGREVPDLRARCGLEPDVPLLVYSGSSSPTRGLGTMVRTLPELPGVHVALVVGSRGGHVRELEADAEELGVRDRVHVLRYVPADLVAPFLASATAGVIPIRHFPNHEIALITKYFEYLHARLPLVVSDVEVMARKTRELGNGVVFAADDPADYVRVVRELVADPARFTKVYAERPELFDELSWERQAEILAGLWRRVAGQAPQPRRAAGADVAGPPSVDPVGGTRPAAPTLLQLWPDDASPATAERWAEGLRAAGVPVPVEVATPAHPGSAHPTHVVLVGRGWLDRDAPDPAERLLTLEQRGARLRLAAAVGSADRAALDWLGLPLLPAGDGPGSPEGQPPVSALAAFAGARAETPGD